MSHQEIKCSVGSCRFNSNHQQCTLNEITVGSDAVFGEPRSEHETICSSFTEK